MGASTLEARQALERDRAALAETLEALAAKADLKGRVRDAAQDDAARLAQKARAVGPGRMAAFGMVVLAGTAIAVVWTRLR